MMLTLKRLVPTMPLIALFTISTALRLVNIGYSNYQGDEIKAFYIPKEGQNISSFLLAQRKGPVQFIVNMLVHDSLGVSYDNQLVTRLPFGIVAVLSVFFFYKLLNIHFGKKVALYSTFFFATNGFLLAFARIVQYQSFVIFFMVLALYFLSIKKIFLGLVFWALSILSHYDGIFIAPFAFYLLILWFKDVGFTKKAIFTFIFSGVISAGLILIFYLPFIMNLSEATSAYWAGRLTGNVAAKISSSRYLFTVYQPIYVVHIYAALSLLGFVSYAYLLLYRSKLYIKLIKFSPNFLYWSQMQTKTGLLITLFLWFLVPLIFMEAVVYIPGTHIYAYLIPLMIFMSFGLILGENIFKAIFARLKLSKIDFVYYVCVGAVFIFIFLQSWAVFVDNVQEYPWQEEKFLIFTMPKPTPIFHLSMFGFPYYRDWQGIRDFIAQNPIAPAYSTNERVSIARYYVPLVKTSTQAGYYIYIKYPQTFTSEIKDRKVLHYVDRTEPVYVYSRNGVPMTRVYAMKPGPLELLGTEIVEPMIEPVVQEEETGE